MELPFQKFNGRNFYNWQVKTRMRLMHEDLWKIVKEGGGTDIQKAKAKAIIGLAVSDSYIHFIDLTKIPKEIWDRLSLLFGNGQGETAKISLKSQLYSVKMQDKTSLSSYINYLTSLRSQLTEIVEKEKATEAKEEKEKINSLTSLISQLAAEIEELVQIAEKDNMTEREAPSQLPAEIVKLAVEIAEKEKTISDLEEILEKEKAIQEEKKKKDKGKEKISDPDFIAIILNSLSSMYNNVVFTLSQVPSKSLDDTIALLLAEEKRMNT